MPRTTYSIQQLGPYRYLDEGGNSDFPPVVLLHGMLGDLSNWTNTIGALAQGPYRVIVPVLPVYDLPLKQTSVAGLAQYLREFLNALHLGPVVLAGNSLGGHIALLYALHYPESVTAMVLSGSSGIYEVTTGSSKLRRQDREFIRERAAYTFYDAAHATDELVDEMYAIVNDRARVLRLIKMARATKEETITEHLSSLKVPILLVWGKEDPITPPDVAEEFLEHLPHAELRFIDRCGHAPMIEHPEQFTQLMLEFLHRTVSKASMAPS